MMGWVRDIPASIKSESGLVFKRSGKIPGEGYLLFILISSSPSS
jgi:hypothetical protein